MRNIWHNPSIAEKMDKLFSKRKKCEEYWRNVISIEIYDNCIHSSGKFPCEECVEMFEFVREHRTKTIFDLAK